MSLRVSAMIFQLFKVIMPEKCALTIQELNWNQRSGQDKIERLSSYVHVVHTSAKQVISRHRKNEGVFNMSKEEKCTCKACKNDVFHCQICKFVGFLLSTSLAPPDERTTSFPGSLFSASIVVEKRPWLRLVTWHSSTNIFPLG